jgi:hypothetical protein
LAAGSVGQALHRYAGFVADFHHRASPLRGLLTQVDPEIAELRARTEQERLRGVTEFLAELARRELIAPAAASAPHADGLWVLTSPAVFEVLVHGRGWTLRRYRRWLEEMMGASIRPRHVSGGTGGTAGEVST